MSKITWSNLLSEREGGIDSLQLILAGPILRRVTSDSVTVWLALRKSKLVQLFIKDEKGENNLFNSKIETPIRIGENLYIICITAVQNGPCLVSGKIYTYDIIFEGGDNLKKALGGGSDIISYFDHGLPSFVLPADDIRNLKLFHGSCRKPHGPGNDALAILDGLIYKKRDNADERPQLMIMTGDQIYADDVADALLYIINDAAKVLLGETYSEWLPGDWKDSKIPGPDENLIPGNRAPKLHKHGITSGISADLTVPKSHLIGFYEYVLMYVFVWSDVLWPDNIEVSEDINQKEDFALACEYKLITNKLPLFRNNEILEKYDNWDPNKMTSLFKGQNQRREFRKYKKELKDLSIFIKTLKSVRKALANIPTYMIFDDHEVTDDWNICAYWCARLPANDITKGIYQDDLGRRIVANALSAYVLCQSWGNDYVSFTSGNGREFLEFLRAGRISSEENKSKLEEYLLPKGNILSGYLLNAPVKPIKWHYKIVFPSFELVVLDIRTKREYPSGAINFPRVISDSSLQEQITPFEKDNIVVVFPDPFIGVEFIEENKQAPALKSWESFLDMDCEAPGLDKYFFESFLAHLLIQSNTKKRNIYILSGDVHYGFSSILEYRAKKTLHEQKDHEEYSLTLFQLTSSALKNEPDSVINRFLLSKSDNEVLKQFIHKPIINRLGFDPAILEKLKINEISKEVNIFQPSKPIDLFIQYITRFERMAWWISDSLNSNRFLIINKTILDIYTEVTYDVLMQEMGNGNLNKAEYDIITTEIEKFISKINEGSYCYSYERIWLRDIRSKSMVLWNMLVMPSNLGELFFSSKGDVPYFKLHYIIEKDRSTIFELLNPSK